MQNKTILITGGTGGIGKQTALALAKLGAHIIVTGRNQANGQTTVNELKQLSDNPNIDLVLTDLSLQADVRNLAQQVKQKFNRLDILINNAGTAEPQRRLTVDRIETDFAVNVLTPFLLTHLLMDCLQASSAARVITLSGGEHPSKIDLDNLQGERSFIGLSTYSHSKLVMMAVMYEFAQRVRDTSVTINVCYPGQASTTMTQSVTPEMIPGVLRLIYPIFKLATRADNGESAAKASRASIYLASSPDVQGMNGKYLNPQCKQVDWPKPVLDDSVRQQLWSMAEQLTHLAH